MLAFKLLFHLCLFNFAESCLKIRYPGPPKCECPSLLLNWENFKEYDVNGVVRDEESHISSFPLLVLEDENCTVSMYCSGDQELVVFDMDKTHEFLNYPADGMCDPYTQKWIMGDNEGSLITLNRLYGICWKLLNQQPPVTQEPGCKSCKMAALGDVLPEGVEFHYEYHTPTADGCLRVYAICHRTDALICHDTEINAHNPNGMWPIATEKTEAAASTTLTCAADGKFYYDNNIRDIYKLSCEFSNCY
ncbi:unnamed protein product [Caenorhabditis nigoni]